MYKFLMLLFAPLQQAGGRFFLAQGAFVQTQVEQELVGPPHLGAGLDA